MSRAEEKVRITKEDRKKEEEGRWRAEADREEAVEGQKQAEEQKEQEVAKRKAAEDSLERERQIQRDKGEYEFLIAFFLFSNGFIVFGP